MEVLVMNRSAAIAYGYKRHDEKSIVVSINNLDDYPAKIKTSVDNGIVSVLRLFFDDIDSGSTAMTPDDANKIANFVRFYQHSVDRIIVHCEAGVSRSAGVAAAIMCYLFGGDDIIFNDSKYYPNMHCYRITLHSLLY